MSNNVHVSVNERQTSTFLGMDNHVLLGTGQTDGLAGVVEITIQPGAGAPLHTNTREALMWYVIEGTLALETEDGRTVLAPGDVMFMPKGRTHAFTNPSDYPARTLFVALPGGHEEFLLELSGKLPADVAAGPPAPDTIETLVTTAARYGIIVHTPAPA
ncbi:cupin domain-containing protein [Saccharothrix deserti]|uniref:cupin domain-containing protein n=1 Tax=Saccharothrix deserti TaxID=2593674 RepID=UPI00131B5731|nr:cupin domain-containing protein [Saccharothrix deserti]